ncbi:hypothetical protein FACS1894152_6260 [Bacilli bacterium]|nr:hypothetical protein FACS1894152_6260 [Bacilli bacterium]
MIIKNRFLPLAILLLFTGCSSRKGGDIFVNSNSNLIVKTETKKLKFKLGDSVKGDASTFRNGNDIFITSMSNELIKFSLETDTILWKKSIGSIPQANLSFNGNKEIYFTTIDNNFYILDYDTGKIEFIYDNLDERTITATVKPIYYEKNNLIVVTFNGGEVIIFDNGSKEILQTIPTKPSGKVSVIVENNILMVDEQAIDLDKVSKTGKTSKK